MGFFLGGAVEVIFRVCFVMGFGFGLDFDFLFCFCFGVRFAEQIFSRLV